MYEEKTYSYVFTFGKYKGKTLRQILDKDPRYVSWCIDNIEWFHLPEDIIYELMERLDDIKQYEDTIESCRYDIY